MKFSLRQFKRKYGTHDQCLEAIKVLRFPTNTPCPKCSEITVFYKVGDRTSYACKYCGWHVYPLAGTIFEKSTTGLDLWFFAMYLMVQTRAGISAKQLERMLGVTYKTAWRMFKQIRILMAQGESMLDGIVEVDETYIGGKGKNRAYQWKGSVKKEAVMGIVQRRGKAFLKHVPNTTKYTLINQIQEHVSPKAFIMSDEAGVYKNLYEQGYPHHYAVNHSESKYVRWHGLVHNNSVESLWSHLKRGIYGVYRNVSIKYLQAYVDEYTWRYNNRQSQGKMFDILLKQVIEVKVLQPVLVK